jgi:hypothetical protein
MAVSVPEEPVLELERAHSVLAADSKNRYMVKLLDLRAQSMTRWKLYKPQRKIKVRGNPDAWWNDLFEFVINYTNCTNVYVCVYAHKLHF